MSSFSNNMAAWSRQQRVQRAQTAKDLTAYYAQVNKRTHKMGGAERVTIDGYKFASTREAKRYKDLKLMHAANLISALLVHPSTDIVINGTKVCKVVCDFSYWDIAKKKMIVEDVKKETRGRDGKITFTTNTDLSKIKQRLMLAVHGIEIVLVK